MFLSKFCEGQFERGKINLFVGYNYGRVPTLFTYKEQASQLRVNIHAHPIGTKAVPYFNFDILLRRFQNNYDISNPKGGYSTPRIRNNFIQTQALLAFDLGIRINSKNQTYWQMGIGTRFSGKRLINGSRITNSAGNYFKDSIGQSKFGWRTDTSYFNNNVEHLSADFFKPFVKVEYGFQSKLSAKHNLNCKVGLSTFNAYFLIGLSRRK